MTRVINLFAGPGAGKSTTAAGLFYLMKNAGMKCELVTEHAKELTYEEDWRRLSFQYSVLAEQERRQARLRDKVDWVITDSPLNLSAIYVPDVEDKAWVIEKAWEKFNSYDNLNILLKRKKPYHAYGRSQTEEEAREIDQRIWKMMDGRFDLCVPGNPQGLYEVYDYIRKL